MIVEIPCMVPGVLIGYEIRPLWEMVSPSEMERRKGHQAEELIFAEVNAVTCC